MTESEFRERVAAIGARSGAGCWEWDMGRQTGKYGRLNFGGDSAYAHRVSYLVHNGEITPGLFVCHHCDNPICVRPDHLFLGTSADNNRDKARKGRTVNPLTDTLKTRTHCPKGHPYDEANTMWRSYKDRKGRACRACLRAWGRAGDQRKRAEREALGLLRPRHPLTQRVQRMPQTHCLLGHPLSGDNVYIAPKTGAKNCKTCRRMRSKTSYARRATRAQ